MKTLTGIYFVFLKDLRSELRSRYALHALLMFVVIAVATLVFAVKEEPVSKEILSGLFWVVIFFSAMSGLSRVFVSEEERGTAFTLRLLTPPLTVYFGKLLFNVVLTLLLTMIVTALYLIVFPSFVILSPSIFLVTLILGGTGFASAATSMAAIIAKTASKGTLYPVLSFPVLIPLLLIVMNATTKALEGDAFLIAFEELQFMAAYSMVIIGSSYVLFDYIWRE